MIQVFFCDSYTYSLRGSRARHAALCKMTCCSAKGPESSYTHTRTHTLLSAIAFLR